MISNEGHEPFRKNHPISISWERKFNFEPPRNYCIFLSNKNYYAVTTSLKTFIPKYDPNST